MLAKANDLLQACDVSQWWFSVAFNEHGSQANRERSGTPRHSAAVCSEAAFASKAGALFFPR